MTHQLDTTDFSTLGSLRDAAHPRLLPNRAESLNYKSVNRADLVDKVTVSDSSATHVRTLQLSGKPRLRLSSCRLQFSIVSVSFLLLLPLGDSDRRRGFQRWVGFGGGASFAAGAASCMAAFCCARRKSATAAAALISSRDVSFLKQRLQRQCTR